MLDRREILLRHANLSGHGLEIGPLDKPLVGDVPGSIEYADHLAFDDVVAKYRHDPLVDTARIPRNRYVIGASALSPGLAGARFDYIVASHVVEHVPDLIGWLDDVYDCLTEAGILALAIPDKRFTFDRLRRCTSLSDAVDAHFSAQVAPSFGQVFDHVAYVRPVDLGAAWDGAGAVAAEAPEGHGLEAALRHCQSMHRAGRYFDVHCQVFTPDSFARLFSGLRVLGLIRLQVVDFVETPCGEHEFYVVLRRGDAGPNALPLSTMSDLPVPAGDHAALALQQALAALETEHAELRAALDAREAAVSELEAALAESERARAALADSLTIAERERAARADELAALRRSTSWRLTGPLRRPRRWLARLSG